MKTLLECIREAVDSGIVVTFRQGVVVPGELSMEMRKEIEGFGPIGAKRFFGHRSLDVDQGNVVVFEMESLTRHMIREDQNMRVT